MQANPLYIFILNHFFLRLSTWCLAKPVKAQASCPTPISPYPHFRQWTKSTDIKRMGWVLLCQKGPMVKLIFILHYLFGNNTLSLCWIIILEKCALLCKYFGVCESFKWNWFEIHNISWQRYISVGYTLPENWQPKDYLIYLCQCLLKILKYYYVVNANRVL